VAGAKLDEMDKIAHLFNTLSTNYEGAITTIGTPTEINLT